MNRYPISVHKEKDHLWSSCPDIPEAHSAADTIEELLENAVEGITLAMSIYVDRGVAIPAPGMHEAGQHVVTLPVAVGAKAILWNEMCAQGMRIADLARTLELSHTPASRLVDFEHKSKIEQIEAALAALGRRLQISAV